MKHHHSRLQQVHSMYPRLLEHHQQGEELKNHRDRPACEISATITLDFEGDVWPIYMGDDEDKTVNVNRIDMKVGDAVMYRGCDKWHWRESYVEGKWQAQVFLHYVDQNGPYAEWKYDKRESLGLSKTIQNQSFDDCYKVDGAISESFCKRIIAEYAKPEVEKELPFIGEGSDLDKNINLDIRNVQRLQMPLFAGIGATLTAIGLQVNHQIWQYHITHSNQSEFLMYDIHGKYETHVDTFHSRSNETRVGQIMANPNGRKGSAFEIGVLKWLRSRGVTAERLRLSGSQDEGDIVAFIAGKTFVLEAF